MLADYWVEQVRKIKAHGAAIWDKVAAKGTCHQRKMPPPGNTMRGLTGRADVAVLVLSSSGILLKR